MNMIHAFQKLSTPFYYYDITLLRETLRLASEEARRHHFHLHYAVKANANPRLLAVIREYGLGADCVSGNEVAAALESNFPGSSIVYAGVGKSDKEIRFALENDILCFNCESFPELEIIDAIAGELHKKAKVALRINPNVDAHTHHYITTGLEENKFGFYLYDLEKAVERCHELKNIDWIGLHFHIGSQITDLTVFRGLCIRVNEIQQRLLSRGFTPRYINFGGGLGINYDCPTCGMIPDFASYFQTFADFFEALPGQQIHFEPGRSLVGQCGSLISRVLYIKEGKKKKFAILDAGMSDLIRPALYQAFHRMENLTSTGEIEPYDIVGPICESADSFGKAVDLPVTRRNDLIALRSCGAYGEVMASRYNLRPIPPAHYSDELADE